MRVQESLMVQGVPEQVWEALIDFESRTKWSDRFSLARVIPEGPVRVGSRVEIAVGGSRFMLAVAQIRPPEHLALELMGAGSRASHIYELRGTGGATDHNLDQRAGGSPWRTFRRLQAGLAAAGPGRRAYGHQKRR